MSSSVQSSAEGHLENIEGLESLKPCRQTNKILSALVDDILKENVSEKELQTSEIQRLRRLCGEAEFKLEKRWAGKVVESKYPRQKIREFPYYSNYMGLADFEYSTLVGCCNRLEKKAVFVGGGPLPMTAITFARHYDFDVTVIDRDRDAVDRSRKLLESLSMDVDVLRASAETFDGYDDYDTVHVASMVGQDEEEEMEVFQNIKYQLDDHTHVMARTVHGTRRLLYRPVSSKVRRMFSVEAERGPSKEIINSAMVLSIH